MHIISWGEVCRSKKNGGLGIRKIKELNLGLLAKQLWSLLLGAKEWSSILSEKYLYGVDKLRVLLVKGFSPPLEV